VLVFLGFFEKINLLIMLFDKGNFLTKTNKLVFYHLKPLKFLC